MLTLANFLIGVGVLALVALGGATVGYFIGRSVDPSEPEEQQLEEADEFATVLTAPVWTPPVRPVMPRYSHTEKVEPLPPGVFGVPIGTRRPLAAEAFVDRLPGYGRHARADQTPPLPVLVLAMRKHGPGTTQEFNEMTKGWEVEHVA